MHKQENCLFHGEAALRRFRSEATSLWQPKLRIRHAQDNFAGRVLISIFGLAGLGFMAFGAKLRHVGINSPFAVTD